MSRTELERRVTDVLNRHAEDAMNTTNTEERLVELLDTTRSEDGRRQRRLLAAGLAAAVALAGLVLWAATRDREDARIQPAQPISPEQVATEYLQAAASYDLARAESYFAEDADLHDWGGVEGWRATQLWNQAALADLEPRRCQSATSDLELVRVECPYSYSGVGSKELGLPPFEGSSYVFTVRDGAIVTVTDHFEYQSNGYNVRVWEPFAKWVNRNYPEDAEVMYVDDFTNYSTSDRSIQLWHQHLFEYIAAKLAKQ